MSRETVSRWEKEAKYPSIEKQALIGKLAASLNVDSVFGIAQVVTISPFPMMLTDKNDLVIAATKSSGFIPGKTVIDQTPEDERPNYTEFSDLVSDTGFWENSGNTFEYKFEIDGDQRRAVIQSVG